MFARCAIFSMAPPEDLPVNLFIVPGNEHKGVGGVDEVGVSRFQQFRAEEKT